MSVQKEMKEPIHYGDPAATGGISVFDQEFDNLFSYDGNDLGLIYTPHHSSFCLWAPTAFEAEVVLYPAWQDAEGEHLPMTREVRGTWRLNVPGDLEGKFYTYRVRVGEQWNEAADPYARAVGVNGDRSAILDMSKTNPARWTEDKPPLADPVDAIIYELHLRDLSVHPASGIAHKSQYLGLAEEGTRGPGGIATGLDHIAGLGVTHVQLLPIYDYATESVDETKLDQPHYNWGYDPKNYNAPEGSYATNPYAPAVRIRELKTMIQALHDRGLRVIMDVVYNHVYDGFRVNFTKLVPGYYLRYKPDGSLSDGSGCGNDVATERLMVSRFIVESVLYWAKEYHIDGFRFDLMGLMDVGTMQEIRRRLDDMDPSIMTIGEGWIMDTELAPEKLASQSNADLLPGIGHFNDGFRDAVKGNIFRYEERGFVSGKSGLEQAVKTGITGGVVHGQEAGQFADEPQQCVNFVECHDNHTLWDKIVLSTKGESDSDRAAMHRLASAMVLTSQGIPFLHAGQEFMRTKGGVENSYKSPVEVNWMDWERCAAHAADVAYMRRLIALRKAHPAFRLRTAEEIRASLMFEQAPAGAVAYTLRGHAGGDAAEHLYVLYNANPDGASLKLPALGEWSILFGEELAPRLAGGKLTVGGTGMVVLAVQQ
ncbi:MULTISPECIES: type I pullulanase [unclassified Paenibacillus]|uniref:type I pullulanase n=1 Tax=unclassified Paenibacillus TaxID=185978 RepID=UPI002406B818|nr:MULTISPECIES: type I pullulanase [unclassified Paenibacillus]MDF9840875.1 pullulanase [Paenibacillus sp. PastF-2]MDF9847459.1 pullulanase [Paenibacillus sp. PastM-2]MDF9853964.1 pullulanase [Paenibacillus sp. PastF-1]MDH6479236.1 pullulanase [Paenibacillus sp. PastH-2]MDH6507028.1 pullulanase [Paenibacillus sp. PastM-3]